MSATTSYGHAGAMGRHRVPLSNSVCSVSAKTIVQAEPHLVGVCDFERGRRDRSTVLPRRANPSRSRVGDRPGALVRGAEKTFDNAEKLYFEAALLAKAGATARVCCATGGLETCPYTYHDPCAT
jgi:hypothetical protein